MWESSAANHFALGQVILTFGPFVSMLIDQNTLIQMLDMQKAYYAFMLKSTIDFHCIQSLDCTHAIMYIIIQTENLFDYFLQTQSKSLEQSQTPFDHSSRSSPLPLSSPRKMQLVQEKLLGNPTKGTFLSHIIFSLGYQCSTPFSQELSSTILQWDR